MSEWKRVKLRDCVEEVDERTTENNQYEILTSSKSGIYSQEDYFDKQVASKNNTGYKIIKRGQFTYRSMSDNGRFTINRLENKDIGIVSPAYPVFEAIDINAEYLKYFFQSEGFRKEIYNLSQGSTRAALKYRDLSNIEILLPPIEEQEKIVKILKNIDSIIKKYKNLLEEKNQFIKSQFAEMFENKEYPKKRMDEVAILKSGTTFNKEYELQNGDLLYCKVSDMNLQGNEKYMISSKTYVTKDVGLKSSIPANSVIFPKRGGAIGNNKKRIIIKDTCVDLNTMGVTPKESINIQYLYYYFINIDLATLCDGSAVPQLNNKNIGPLEISVAPIEIQQHFANIEEQIDKQKFLLDKQKQNYEKLKKGIMQKLLTGKVRVKI